MKIRDLFVSDITRDIPPVVYFHEQSPDQLAAEVDEYIFTGGWEKTDDRFRRIPVGIHEEYVRLVEGINRALEMPGGPSLPTVWISGFYGSGKSSFAKLLGMALDGVELPDGRSMAEAWLARNNTQRRVELESAWHVLRQKVDPIAVVFDVGGVARQDEHVHSVVVRQLQRRLGYCSTSAQVAHYELKLERDGKWADFLAMTRDVLKKDWENIRDQSLAEDDFSLVLHHLFPRHYTDPMSWIDSRDGVKLAADSPQEAAEAIRDMLGFRRPDATLFVVIDEVSQYVLASKDRVDKLRVFASALGSVLRGKAWLVALGQQKLDEDADDDFLVWARDRFPPELRVHLASSNIRDVIHQRLLKKKDIHKAMLEVQFEHHRADLKLYAYGCEEITAQDFVSFYPMLPGHIDLLLQITSALRRRSRRAQGDDQAIRGLLQLLGELFRARDLAEQGVGALVTLDEVYEVQQTALDADTQSSMRRIVEQCVSDDSGMQVKAAKAVVLLELIQEQTPTTAELVARCLYARIDQGSNVREAREALEALRRRNLLSYSEKSGYKIQSTAGEEWDRTRRDIGVSRQEISTVVSEALKYRLAEPARPRLQGRPFPWAGNFSDGRQLDDIFLLDPRDSAALRVDLRFIDKEARAESVWIKRSDETVLRDRLIWVCGETSGLESVARELLKSRRMIQRYEPRRESLSLAWQLLLRQEKDNEEELTRKVSAAIEEAWCTGRMYFRGRVLPVAPGSFAKALTEAAPGVLAELFPHFIPTQITDGELMQLIAPELSGPSPKFMSGELGILELDAGRYTSSCSGVVPQRIREFIEGEDGVSGTGLLAHFSGPPFGYTASVIKACVAGLLRGGLVRIQPEGGTEITALRDAGVQDLLKQDRVFRRANLFPSGEDDIGRPARARICRFFELSLGHAMDREDHAIADAVAQLFPRQSDRLREVERQLSRLPGDRRLSPKLSAFYEVLEQCIRASRQTRPTVRLVKKHLDVLRDGVQELNITSGELTEAKCQAVLVAAAVQEQQAGQLSAIEKLDGEAAAASARLGAHLAGERPWRDIEGLGEELSCIRAAYSAERQRLLQWQEARTEESRAEIKRRPDFSTISGQQSHHVLRPIAEAISDTTADALRPPLAGLREPFLIRLEQATAEANERLDEIIREKGKGQVAKVKIGLRNREVRTEAELEALLEVLRERVKEHLARGERVRLL